MTALEALHQAIYDRLVAFSPWPVIDTTETEAEPPFIIMGEGRVETIQEAGIPDAFSISLPISSVAPGDTVRVLNALMATVYDCIDEPSLRSALEPLGWRVTAIGVETQRRGPIEQSGLRTGEQTIDALLEPVY